MNLLIVIPAYNSESTIKEVIEGCRPYANTILVVNDGSIDKTGDIAEKEALCVSHCYNRGKGAALKTGFKEVEFSSPDVIVTIDADLQHDPARIPELVKPIIEGKADIVIGSRYLKPSKETPLHRRAGQKVLDGLLHIAGGEVLTDSQSGFRAYRASIVKEFLEIPDNGFSFESKVILKAAELNMRMVEIPIEASYLGMGCHTLDPLTHGLGVFVSLMTEVIKVKVMGC